MPTKALLYAAEVMHLVRHPETWGIRTEDVSFNFSQVMARKDALIKEFADYRAHQLQTGKFKFVRALASFIEIRRQRQPPPSRSVTGAIA